MGSARTVSVCLWLWIAAGASVAQCGLTTTFVGGANAKGCMFDVVATQYISVTGFHQNLPPGTHTIQVYTKAGTWVGSQNSPSAWTLVGTASNVTSAGLGLPTPIPLVTSWFIVPGATRAFYVTSSGTSNVAYTNGTAVGAVAAQDAYVQILQGAGINYPFAGATFQPRTWNGRLLYMSGSLPEFQVNQPGASMALDGIQGTPCEKAVMNRTICSAGGSSFTDFSAELSGSAAGGPFDIVFTAVPSVPASAGGIITTNIQVVNLDLTDPQITPLFGSGGMPFANATIPFSVNFPIDTTLQMVIADPTSPDGAWLTQATEIHIAVAANPIPLPVPAGDDTFHTYSFASLPCGPPSFPFYGTAHSTFSVVSNGRVMFGTPVVDFNPTVASAMSQSPSINRWVDLNLDPTTGGGGSVAISIPAPGVIRVQWTAVPLYAAVGSANTFALVMDSLTGAVTIDNGLSFQQVTPTPPNMFLGISPGGPVATNPGAAAFVIGGPFPGPGGGGMTYQFGAAGTLALGVSSLVFVPNVSGNYGWSGF